MDLKYRLEILFDIGSWSMILSIQLNHVTFSKNGKFCSVLLPNLLLLNVNVMACLNVDASTKKLHIL